MQSINFPKQIFRTAIRGYVRKDGEGLNACLWRELLQNARDAGATRCEATLETTDTQVILTFRDNGRGMDWETLEKGMLTYGGSIKPADAAGGFGAAKLVLCFSSDETIIHTRDNKVRIDGIMYERLDTDYSLLGTEIVIKCPKSEAPDTRLEPTEEGLRFLLSRCSMGGMEVYLGGEKIPDCPLVKSDEVEVQKFTNFDGKAFFWKNNEPFMGLGKDSVVAVLTHRGIWICDMPLPNDVKGAVLVDVEMDPKKCLNDTRTNLSSYWQRSELEKWIGKLNQGAQSALKTKKFVQRFDGGMFIAVSRQSAKRVVYEKAESGLGITLTGPDAQALLTAVAEHLADVPEGVQRLSAPQITPSIALDRLSNLAGQDKVTAAKSLVQLMWAPALMVVNEREAEVPTQYMPATMSVRVKTILTVWSELVRQFLIWREEFRPFGVGFVFSDDTKAMYKTEEDGTIWFLVNPLDAENKARYTMSRVADRNSLIVSAAHEVAHCNAPYAVHGDSFVTEFGCNMRHALDGAMTLNKIWQTAR